MPRQRRINRRDLLKRSAGGVAAAAALPTIIPASALGKDGKLPPSDRVTLGLIGSGDLGRRHHLQHLLHNEQMSARTDVAAVCDVDRNHRDDAARMCRDKTGKRVGVYKDFRQLLERKDVDAVFVVTPDHWHAIASITAMEAGKDIYCQKPLTLTIEEGVKMVETARRYGTVFQTGSQQRSDGRFRQACELAVNEKFGKLDKVETFIGNPPRVGWMSPGTPPDHLDWDFWLGPAPYTDYYSNRVHYEFRWFSDYSGGKMTDWGAHHNDTAQWGMGMDGTGPISVEGKGKLLDPEGAQDVARDFEVHYKYAGGVELICRSGGENGARFVSGDNWVFVNRGKIEASDPEILKIELGPNDKKLYKSDDHHANFLDCIATRERPICDVEIGHRSATVCHLGNIAIKLGRKLEWDPKAERFVNDEGANRLVSKPYRAPWHL